MLKQSVIDRTESILVRCFCPTAAALPHCLTHAHPLARSLEIQRMNCPLLLQSIRMRLFSFSFLHGRFGATFHSNTSSFSYRFCTATLYFSIFHFLLTTIIKWKICALKYAYSELLYFFYNTIFKNNVQKRKKQIIIHISSSSISE